MLPKDTHPRTVTSVGFVRGIPLNYSISRSRSRPAIVVILFIDIAHTAVTSCPKHRESQRVSCYFDLHFSVGNDRARWQLGVFLPCTPYAIFHGVNMQRHVTAVRLRPNGRDSLPSPAPFGCVATISNLSELLPALRVRMVIGFCQPETSHELPVKLAEFEIIVGTAPADHVICLFAIVNVGDFAG